MCNNRFLAKFIHTSRPLNDSLKYAEVAHPNTKPMWTSALGSFSPKHQNILFLKNAICSNNDEKRITFFLLHIEKNTYCCIYRVSLIYIYIYICHLGLDSVSYLFIICKIYCNKITSNNLYIHIQLYTSYVCIS